MITFRDHHGDKIRKMLNENNINVCQKECCVGCFHGKFQIKPRSRDKTLKNMHLGPFISGKSRANSQIAHVVIRLCICPYFR